MLKRIGITVAATVLATFVAASAAQAKQVSHSNFTFSESNDFPTGSICDFNLRQEFTATVHATDFGDPDEPGKEIAETNLSLNDINLDTGAVVSEADHTVTIFNAEKQTFAIIGVNTLMRTPDGRIVAVLAGRFVFDTETGEILSFTPNSGSMEGAMVICQALGGDVA